MPMPALRPALERVLVKLSGGARRPGEPPLVPTRLPFLGHALAYGRDPGALFRACQRTHGDIFTLLIAGQRMHFVLDPHCWADVLKAADVLSFGVVSEGFSVRAFGHAPSASFGIDPDAVHKLYDELLKGPALGPLTARTHDRVQAHLGGLATPQWQQDDLYAFLRRHVFAINMETLFGDGSPAPDSEAAFKTLDDAFPLLIAGVPARLLPGVVAARDRLVAAIDVVRPDASAFVTGRDAYVLPRATRHYRNHIQLAGLWAGVANTLPATFWALYHLLRHPEARAAVLAELRAVDGDLALPATLKKLPLFHSSVLEALRLSSSSLLVRQVMRPFTLTLSTGESYALREGDRICLAPELNHTDPELFAEPERFRFDRFVGADGPAQFFKRGKRVPLALMPFGAGVSMCPGRFLASNEVVQIVAFMLTRFELELLPHEPPALDRRRGGLGILPPRSDLRFRYRRS
jgi:cytochrome P450